jgi:hypothetical protein
MAKAQSADLKQSRIEQTLKTPSCGRTLRKRKRTTKEVSNEYIRNN